MTVADPTNEWYTTRQQSALTASPRRGVVLHHGATTSMDAILAMETSGSRQVSSNRVIKDRRCARVTAEHGVRAWSLSSPYWDSVLRSAECANQSTAGWTLSTETHETAAQMVAFWAQQDGFYPHRSGKRSTWTVFGHREIYEQFGASYATACPGGMDLQWITLRAQAILAGTTTKGNDVPSIHIQAGKPTGDATKTIGITDGYHAQTFGPGGLGGETANDLVEAFGAPKSISTRTWNRIYASGKPTFDERPGAVVLTDAQLAKIAVGVRVDLTVVLAAIAELPSLILTRLRAFWSSGK